MLLLAAYRCFYENKIIEAIGFANRNVRTEGALSFVKLDPIIDYIRDTYDYFAQHI